MGNVAYAVLRSGVVQIRLYTSVYGLVPEIQSSRNASSSNNNNNKHES